MSKTTLLSGASAVVFSPFNILIVRCEVKWVHGVMVVKKQSVNETGKVTDSEWVPEVLFKCTG